MTTWLGSIGEAATFNLFLRAALTWSTCHLMQTCSSECVQNLLDNSYSIILNFTAPAFWFFCISIRRGSTNYAMKKGRTLGNGRHPQASTLGWDQVHVNTTLPRFIDAAAFCGILIGVAVIPRKTWAWKWNAPCWGSSLDRTGQGGRRPVSERSITPL